MATNENPSPNDPIFVLSAEESWKRLSTQTLGRLVVSLAGRIDIFPVNFVTHEGKVFFRTAEGTKLVALTIHDEVVFQAEEVGPDSAWSVVVHGTARRLEGSSEIAAADELDLHPWVPTIKDNYVEITPTEVTGRLVAFGEEPERHLGRY